MKLKIGEFSRLMRVTVKTLRHWEQMGLLMPCEVDEWTGYRYYRLEQMQRVNAIRNWQAMGFSLDEIRGLYEEEGHTPDLARLDEKIRRCEEELEQLLRRRDRLRQLADSQKKIINMDKFSIQALPAIIVASHRRTIHSYDELGALCVNVIGPEMQRLGCRCPLPGYCFTIEHNKEYRPHDIDIEYCEQVEEMGTDSAIIRFKQLPAVPQALCMKHYGPYDTLYSAYVELFRYIEQHRYKVEGAPRANYVDGIWNQDDPEKWLTIIQVPVSPL